MKPEHGPNLSQRLNAMQNVATSRKMPSWGLLICTYNRRDILKRCIQQALAQSLSPQEIVIVDASDNWEDNKLMIETLIASSALADTLRLVYEQAKVRSSTHQRNQALDLVTVDVAFAIDDDSLMYPDCAETLVSIYAQDTEKKIAAVGACEVATPPDHLDVGSSREVQLKTSLCSKVKSSLKRLLENQLAVHKHFVPYTGWLKPSIRQSGLTPAYVMSGFCTTFRTEFGRKVRWSEVLRYYALHEDSDFSYRLSELGSIVYAEKARICHVQAKSGRLPRCVVDRLRVMNLLALHRIYSPSRIRSAWTISSSYLRFIAIYLLIDPMQGRFSFPVVRAYLYGLAYIPRVLLQRRDSFHNWYQNQQERLLRS